MNIADLDVFQAAAQDFHILKSAAVKFDLMEFFALKKTEFLSRHAKFHVFEFAVDELRLVNPLLKSAAEIKRKRTPILRSKTTSICPGSMRSRYGSLAS
jgi:hypothetical protein